MGIRLRRVIALFFMLSIIGAPHSIVLAEEMEDQPAATPIVNEPQDPADTTGRSEADNTPDLQESDGESDEARPEADIPVGTPDGGESSLQSSNARISPLNSPAGNYALIFVD